MELMKQRRFQPHHIDVVVRQIDNIGEPEALTRDSLFYLLQLFLMSEMLFFLHLLFSFFVFFSLSTGGEHHIFQVSETGREEVTAFLGGATVVGQWINIMIGVGVDV